MPGLVGFTHHDTAADSSRATLQRMQRLMRHTAAHPQDELFCDQHICATRCHTGVLQNDPQPGAGTGLYTWLDGEFYNQDELAPNPGADPQLLLSLYKEDFFAALGRIDGLYAAVLYDPAGRQLYLISDRYALRPLYWTEHRGALAWASEAKALLELPGFAPCIDEGSLEAFLNVGYLQENRTWFEGVRRLPPATVLTWDIGKRCLRTRRYWSWDQVPPLDGRLDADALAAELGQLFSAAVERRSRAGKRVGLMLSGGLDSRAILAALPDRGAALPTLTFGREHSADSRIAARAARLKGTRHSQFEINASNWLRPRLQGVWWLDGMLDLMHMHGIEHLGRMKDLFDIVLNGAGGDGVVGGGHLFENDDFALYAEHKMGLRPAAHPALFPELKTYFEGLGSSHVYYLDHRLRSFTLYGPLLGTFQGLEYRLPFLDNRFQEKLYAVPNALKMHNQLYRKMLLHTFPAFYRKIPWQSTGVPLTWPAWAVRAARLGRRLKPRRAFTDYPGWLRQEPARSLCNEILCNPAALYPEYLPQSQVHRTREEHLGGADRAALLCRYLSFEVFLQQVFTGRWRASN